MACTTCTTVLARIQQTAGWPRAAVMTDLETSRAGLIVLCAPALCSSYATPLLPAAMHARLLLHGTHDVC